MQQKFAYYTPYQFAGNTPIQAVDVDGLEPASVVTVKYRESIVRTEVGPLNLAVYKFTDVAAHVLSLVSGISEKDIAKIEIINSYGTYVPSYNPSKGGGGITIPSKSDHGGQYQIRFTNNFFADDGAGNKNPYGKTDESNNTMDWLALSSHEVGHTKDITEIGGGILKYFSTFAGDYLKSGSHDGTPRETRAEHGAVIFQRFTDFTNKNYGKGSLDKLFNSSAKDADKIKTLDTWFKAFSTAEEQKVFPNYDGNEDKKTKP